LLVPTHSYLDSIERDLWAASAFALASAANLLNSLARALSRASMTGRTASTAVSATCRAAATTCSGGLSGRVACHRLCIGPLTASINCSRSSPSPASSFGAFGLEGVTEEALPEPPQAGQGGQNSFPWYSSPPHSGHLPLALSLRFPVGGGLLLGGSTLTPPSRIPNWGAVWWAIGL
jgi:hypothetical protein